MWLTGKVDMKPVETTIQNLIGSGMNPKTENNPYLGFVYTSFQAGRECCAPRPIHHAAHPRSVSQLTSSDAASMLCRPAS